MGPSLFLLFLLTSTVLHPGSPAPASAPWLHASCLGSQALSRPLVLRTISGLLHAELPPHDGAASRPLLPPPPRERKAGCKSFYWKTLTSC